MPLDTMGKMLFPRLQRWERRRRIRLIFRVLLVAVVLGGMVGGMIYSQAVYRH